MNRRPIVLIPAPETGGWTASAESGLLDRALLGRTLLQRAIEIARGLGPRKIIAAGRAAPPLEQSAFDWSGIEFISAAKIKKELALPALAAAVLAGEEEGDLLVLPADRPLLRTETLREFLNYHRRRRSDLSLLSAVPADPRRGRRVLRGPDGSIRVVDETEAGPVDLAVPEIDAGIYAFRLGGPAFSAWTAPRLRSAALHRGPAAAFGPVFRAGGRVEAFLTPVPDDILQVETLAGVALVGARLRDRVNARLMEAGAMLVDPATAWIDEDVRIAPDAVVAPFTVIEGTTVIGPRTRIGPGCHIVRCVLGEDVVVSAHTVMEDAVIESRATVGPFARLRAGTVLRRGSHVGNFVEMKAADFGAGAKAGHLSYLGDSEVGAGANIGAGTITCNYDGVRKNRTVVGAGAFIGSGSELVAPVTVGAGAYVAAGSVITKDVAPDALAVARGRQTEKPGWAAARRERLEREKRGAGGR